VIGKNSDRSMKRPKDRLISAQELTHMVRSSESSKLDIDEELWLNENIDYVDSAPAVEAVAQEAIKLWCDKGNERCHQARRQRRSLPRSRSRSWQDDHHSRRPMDSWSTPKLKC